MRKALLATLMLAASACTPVQETALPTRLPDAIAQTMVERVFPQTPVFGLSEPVNLSETLHAFAGGPDISGPIRANQWGQYMSPMAKVDEQLKDFPPLIEVMAVESLAEVQCDKLTMAGKDLTQPFVCLESIEVDQGPNRTSQDYLMVMHARVSEMVTDVTAKSGAEAGWQVATMATALVYSQYLHGLYEKSINWPSNTDMESCVAGISSRAVYPQGALNQQSVTNAMAATDSLLNMPETTRANRARVFMRGFDDGKLSSCVGVGLG